MDRKYACYCCLTCENCAVKVKVEPAARALYGEMKQAGFEEVISFIPGGEGFWLFLKGMAENGMCISCKEMGGDPGCAIRLCAKAKGVDMCAFCEDYPCEKLAAFLGKYPEVDRDNALLRDQGWEAWAALQDRRKAAGFTYQNQ